MNLDSKTVERDGQALKLSPIGWRLLEILLRASPQVLSRSTLEHSLWGDEPPDSNSLKVHIFNLRKAIDGDFEIPLLQTVSGQGFALRQPGTQQ